MKRTFVSETLAQLNISEKRHLRAHQLSVKKKMPFKEEAKAKKGPLEAEIKARDVREAFGKAGSRLERKQNVVQPVLTLGSSIQKKNLTKGENTSHHTSAKRPH